MKTGRSASETVAKAWRHRQLAYLKRTPSTPSTTWRPQKLERSGANTWLMCLDKQVLVSLGLPGLSFFKPQGDDPLWQHWSRWPHFNVGMDLGPKGNAGMAAIEYKPDLQLNVDASPCVPHGANCDQKVILKSMGLFEMWMLYMISLNLPFGTDYDFERFRQMQDVLERHFERAPRYTDCLIFVDVSGAMICSYTSRGMRILRVSSLRLRRAVAGLTSSIRAAQNGLSHHEVGHDVDGRWAIAGRTIGGGGGGFGAAGVDFSSVHMRCRSGA